MPSMHLTVTHGSISSTFPRIPNKLTKILLTSSPASQVECMRSIHSVVYTGMRFLTAAYKDET